MPIWHLLEVSGLEVEEERREGGSSTGRYRMSNQGLAEGDAALLMTRQLSHGMCRCANKIRCVISFCDTARFLILYTRLPQRLGYAEEGVQGHGGVTHLHSPSLQLEILRLQFSRVFFSLAKRRHQKHCVSLRFKKSVTSHYLARNQKTSDSLHLADIRAVASDCMRMTWESQCLTAFAKYGKYFVFLRFDDIRDIPFHCVARHHDIVCKTPETLLQNTHGMCWRHSFSLPCQSTQTLRLLAFSRLKNNTFHHVWKTSSTFVLSTLKTSQTIPPIYLKNIKKIPTTNYQNIKNSPRMYF